MEQEAGFLQAPINLDIDRRGEDYYMPRILRINDGP
jgi:hypothetical protein